MRGEGAPRSALVLRPSLRGCVLILIQSIEPVSQDGKTVQRFTIRMDGSGSRQTVTHATNAGFSAGDKVRIENGMMRRN